MTSKNLDCDTIEHEAPIRQGDVLKLVKPNGNPAFRIVVSADCDIAQGRVKELGVSCVPLVTLKQYFVEDYARAQALRRLDRCEQDLCKWINQCWRTIESSNVDLSRDRILKWVAEVAPEEIETALGISKDKKASARLRESAMAINAARSQLGAKSNDAIAALIALYPTPAAETVKSRLESLSPTQLPIDAFFVSQIPGEQELGYVAKLRGLSFLPMGDIFTSMSLAKDKDLAYLRIGRLLPTYKHGLAQQIGTLFSRIGYPEAYERERNEIFSLVLDEIVAQVELSNE